MCHDDALYKFTFYLLTARVSVVVGLVSGMDVLMKVICCTGSALPRGAAASHHADHAASSALQQVHVRVIRVLHGTLPLLLAYLTSLTHLVN